MIGETLALMLSASYWRYRGQQEDHKTSLFWAKLVFSFSCPMWGLNVVRWLVQSNHFQLLRSAMVHLLPVLIPGLWLAGWLLLDRFVRANSAIHTEKLSPEAYRQGNIYALLFMVVSVGATIYTCLTLGAFQRGGLV